LCHLSKTFRQNKTSVEAVKDLSIECADGEIIALLGPSGCGKSTTLRMIAGLEDVTAGEVVVDGKVVNDLRPKDRKMGLVFENYCLYPPLSVYDNIAFNLRARGVSSNIIRDKVNDVAHILQITDILGNKPGQLSAGEKQRVNIARAVVREPKILLMDEPLSHLDGELRKQMRTEIKRLILVFKATSLIVTHDQLEAMALADRIALMKDGLLMQFGTPMEIYNNPDNEFVACFIGEPAMNILYGNVVNTPGGAVFSISGDHMIQLTGFAPIWEERSVEANLGIRPNAIRIVANSSLIAKVLAYEDLGDSKNVLCDLFGQRIFVAYDGAQKVSVNDLLPIEIPANEAFLFDKNTGLRLDKNI
jgi:multiple sugar transport system ATP-binding protein